MIYPHLKILRIRILSSIVKGILFINNGKNTESSSLIFCLIVIIISYIALLSNSQISSFSLSSMHCLSLNSQTIETYKHLNIAEISKALFNSINAFTDGLKLN